MDPKPYLDRRFGRRAFLKGVGALALTGEAAPLAACAGGTPTAVTTPSPSSSPSLRTPIRHVLVAMQENRSFDHYYGYAPFAGSHGVPADYRNPDGRGGFVKPHHLTRLTSADISHTWDNTHREHHRGAMDGFYTTDGPIAMGYYTADDLPYYYSLIESSALCVKYFCSVLGPTYPNRLYLAAGTAGGLTTNGVFGYGVIDYPCILDLLEDAGVSWKVYNIGLDASSAGTATTFSTSLSDGHEMRAQPQPKMTTCETWRRDFRRCRSSSLASRIIWTSTLRPTFRRVWACSAS